MRSTVAISDVRLVCESDDDAERGVLGWVSLVINGQLHLCGIALRRTRAGELTLSYPTRSDRYGTRHVLVRPVDDASRRALERAVLGALAVEVRR